MAPSGRGSFMLPLKVETPTCKEVNLVVKSTQLGVEIIALFEAQSHLAQQRMLYLTTCPSKCLFSLKEERTWCTQSKAINTTLYGIEAQTHLWVASAPILRNYYFCLKAFISCVP